MKMKVQYIKITPRNAYMNERRALKSKSLKTRKGRSKQTQTNRCKDIIKIRAEINEVKIRKQ